MSTWRTSSFAILALVVALGVTFLAMVLAGESYQRVVPTPTSTPMPGPTPTPASASPAPAATPTPAGALGLDLLVGQPVLYANDFNAMDLTGWNLQDGWELAEVTPGDWALVGRGHKFASYGGGPWSDFALSLRVRAVSGNMHLNYRTGGCPRYFTGFSSAGLYLAKSLPGCKEHPRLTGSGFRPAADSWHEVIILGRHASVSVYVDGQLRMHVLDPEPYLEGAFSFETLGDDSTAYVDDIRVIAIDPL